jgi:hypothetical protein
MFRPEKEVLRLFFRKRTAELSRSSAQRAALQLQGPSRAEASVRRVVTAPTRMHGSAKPMRELQNLLPRADHTEAYA